MPKKVDHNCIIEHFRKGMKISEIAKACNCSERTVRRVLQSLKKQDSDDVIVEDTPPAPPKKKKEAPTGKKEDDGGESIWEIIIRL